MKTIIAVSVCLLLTLPLFSQTHVVKGKVTTFNTYPVQNIEVTSKKAKTAVKTDSLGQFELVCKKKDVIQIKAKVFASFSKRVTPEDNNVTANLIFKDSDNNRDAAVGMGYIEPDQLSYALVHLSHENNDFCNYPEIFSLIRVKFPEVEIIRGAGGSSQGIYLRGVKSINLDTEAVYVVDDMIVTDISFVQPCQIGTIEIMKGGGTAQYGTKAVNGVVIIKTKTR